jgi:Domain of unknown function (DUF4377)
MRNAQAIIAILLIALIATACETYMRTEATVYVSPQTTPCENSQFKPTDTCLQISEQVNGPFFKNKIAGFNHEIGFRYKLRIESAQWNSSKPDVISELKLLEILEKTPAQ